MDLTLKACIVEVDPTPGKNTGGLYESGGHGWVSMPSEMGESVEARRLE